MGKVFVDLRESENENIFHYLSNNAKVCVVDFYADWCGPCKKLGQELEMNLPKQKKIYENLFMCENNNFNLLQESVNDKVVFMKINVDSFNELANQFKVQSIPHVIYYKNGKIQSDISRSCNQVFDTVNKLLE